ELGLGERCRLPGTISDAPAFLAGLDVCVLCSRSEGLPNVMLEYMACGRPIVATAVGANPQLIDHGVHGLLVPPEDPGHLAAATRRRPDEPRLAARTAAAARRRVQQRYSKDRLIERFHAFYVNLARYGRVAIHD